MKFSTALLFATASAVKIQQFASQHDEDFPEVLAAVKASIMPNIDTDKSRDVTPGELFTAVSNGGFSARMAADVLDATFDQTISRHKIAKQITKALGRVAEHSVESGYATKAEVEETLRGCLQSEDKKHCDQLAGAIENTYEAATGSDDTAATELAQKGTFTADQEKDLQAALVGAFTAGDNASNGNGKLDSAEVAVLLTHLPIPATASADLQKAFDAEFPTGSADKDVVVTFAATQIEKVAQAALDAGYPAADVEAAIVACLTKADCDVMAQAFAAYHGVGI